VSRSKIRRVTAMSRSWEEWRFRPSRSIDLANDAKGDVAEAAKFVVISGLARCGHFRDFAFAGRPPAI
jgi:hypothetical protein